MTVEEIFRAVRRNARAAEQGGVLATELGAFPADTWATITAPPRRPAPVTTTRSPQDTETEGSMDTLLFALFLALWFVGTVLTTAFLLSRVASGAIRRNHP